jgi:hypothetical protein
VFSRAYVEVNTLHLDLDMGWYVAAGAVIVALLNSAVVIYGACGPLRPPEKHVDKELEFQNILPQHYHYEDFRY